MKKKTDVIIIGAGPAGLMAANHIKEDTIILEKKDTPGRKLLISGAGQCNYTNNCSLKTFFENYGSNKRFVQYALSKFTNKESIEFFKVKGLESDVREDLKVFPASSKAEDSVKALLKDLKHPIIYNSTVKSIHKSGDSFIVKSSTGEYHSKKIVIATGGRTYPKTGSTGDGYEFARMLDIPVTKLSNGLCGIKTVENFSSLSGISLKNITGSIYRENKKIKEITGDLLITHEGLSGPMIINNAREMQVNDLIKINFVNENYQSFDKTLINLSQKHSKKDIINALKILNLPNGLLEFLVKEIDYHKNSAQLSKQDRKILVKAFVEQTFKIKEVGTYNRS